MFDITIFLEYMLLQVIAQEGSDTSFHEILIDSSSTIVSPRQLIVSISD